MGSGRRRMDGVVDEVSGLRTTITAPVFEPLLALFDVPYRRPVCPWPLHRLWTTADSQHCRALRDISVSDIREEEDDDGETDKNDEDKNE